MTQTSSCSFQTGVSVVQLPNKPQDRSVCTSSQSLSVCPYMAQNNTFLYYGDAPASLGCFREPIHNATIDTQLPAPPLHPTIPPTSHSTSCDWIQPPLTHPSQTYGRNFCSQLTYTNSQLTSGIMGPQIPHNPCQVMGLNTSHPFTKPCTLPLLSNGPTNSPQPMPGNGPEHLPPIY